MVSKVMKLLMLSRIVLLLGLFYGCLGLAKEPLITYQLNVDMSKPLEGQFVVETADLKMFTLMLPRIMPNQSGHSNQSLPIQCVNDNDTKTVTYDEPISCKQLTWDVSFKSTNSHDSDVSEQNNLFSQAGWWVLFEWNAVPRFKDHTYIQMCIYMNGLKNRQCQKLPKPNEPPLIMVWGKDRKSVV